MRTGPNLTDEILPLASAVLALGTEIDRTESVDELRRHAVMSRRLAGDMIEAGYGAEIVTRMLSICNDRITAQLVAWAIRRFRMPAAQWCWLGLGSEGRMEQTLITDQDNGLIFAAGDDREATALRDLFLPFARAVNEALAECGFPLCEGEVMASNPDWCLSLEEWQARFSSWIRTPEPAALLNATIFFDFRPLVGDFSLAQRLRNTLTSLARGNDIFLRMMATNALSVEPPLGRIKDFSTDDDEGIDLKKHGSRLFVDVARILALAEGVDAVSTIDRLRLIARPGEAQSGEADAKRRAFMALQAIRLQSQCTRLDTGDVSNRIVPEQINEFDRRVLLESLRQARGLQRRLKARFDIQS